MKLQMALDLDDMQKALQMASSTRDFVDIIEIGTPLIVRFGVDAVKMMKDSFPEALVLADIKIADGGYMEAKFAFDAGADIVTVLGISEDLTIQGVIEAAKESGGLCYVDMLRVPDLASRTREIDRLGADIIGVHTAYDVQKTGKTPFDDLKIIKENIVNAKVAVAGGVSLSTIDRAKDLGADVAIVGGALTKAVDIRGMAEALKAHC